MTRVDTPLIDCHTHIGRLPGVVGEVFSAEDLLYIAEHEGVRFMLASSATAGVVNLHLGTDEALDMGRALDEGCCLAARARSYRMARATASHRWHTLTARARARGKRCSVWCPIWGWTRSALACSG